MPSYQCQDPGRLAQLRPVAVVIHPVTQRHMEPQVAEVSILHTSGLGSDRYCNLVVKVSTHSHGTWHKDSGLWYHILQARRTTGSTSLRSQMMQSQLHSLHFGWNTRGNLCKGHPSGIFTFTTRCQPVSGRNIVTIWRYRRCQRCGCDRNCDGVIESRLRSTSSWIPNIGQGLVYRPISCCGRVDTSYVHPKRHLVNLFFIANTHVCLRENDRRVRDINEPCADIARRLPHCQRPIHKGDHVTIGIVEPSSLRAFVPKVHHQMANNTFPSLVPWYPSSRYESHNGLIMILPWTMNIHGTLDIVVLPWGENGFTLRDRTAAGGKDAAWLRNWARRWFCGRIRFKALHS